MTLYEPPAGTVTNGPAANGSAANGPGTNGSAPEPRRPPKPGGISMRPAMVVLGIAVLILGAFVLLGIASPPPPTPVRHTGSASAVPGSTLKAEAAAGLLAPIVQAGDPPANIVNAVFVPVGSTRISHQNNSGGLSEYDAQVQFRSNASQAELLTFFASDMKLQGWQVFDRGPAANEANTFEVLGKLAGTDGYYWEMGASIAPTTFPAGGPAQGQTDFTVRLFQVGDEQ